MTAQKFPKTKEINEAHMPQMPRPWNGQELDCWIHFRDERRFKKSKMPLSKRPLLSPSAY